MYTNYNIPQNSYYKPENLRNSQSYGSHQYPQTNYTTMNYGTTYSGNGDRFIGGGFLAPFLLGGVGGYLLGRPNYNNFGPGPIPVYFPPQPAPYPYPVPYSSNTNIYY